MAKIENRKKQNPKLRQSELSDGRASLYLEYYLGRSETPVLDVDGNQVFYTEGDDSPLCPPGKIARVQNVSSLQGQEYSCSAYAPAGCGDEAIYTDLGFLSCGSV